MKRRFFQRCHGDERRVVACIAMRKAFAGCRRAAVSRPWLVAMRSHGAVCRLPGLLAALVFATPGCAPIVDHSFGYRDGDGHGIELAPVRGFSNPEDLAAVPGSEWLLVSEYRGAGQCSGGGLTFYHNGTGSRVTAEIRPADATGWGEKGCADSFMPDGFGPQGIDIVKRDGRTVLLVVNHQLSSDAVASGRGCHSKSEIQERVDLFEVHPEEGANLAPALTWRGCVRLPAQKAGNDVAALSPLVKTTPYGSSVPDGLAFAVSHSGYRLVTLRALLGIRTGEILTWNTDRWGCDPALPDADGRPGSWCTVAHSRAVLPNGVAVDESGRTLYFTAFGEKSLLRLDAKPGADTGAPRRSPLAVYPDNLTWSADGRCLLTAGITSHPAGLMRCRKRPISGYCGAPFRIITVDPQTLYARSLWSHNAGRGIGFPSVVQEAGGDLYIGTPVGDRIARLSLPSSVYCEPAPVDAGGAGSSGEH
jgi:hypothetical protein